MLEEEEAAAAGGGLLLRGEVIAAAAMIAAVGGAPLECRRLSVAEVWTARGPAAAGRSPSLSARGLNALHG